MALEGAKGGIGSIEGIGARGGRAARDPVSFGGKGGIGSRIVFAMEMDKENGKVRPRAFKAGSKDHKQHVFGNTVKRPKR